MKRVAEKELENLLAKKKQEIADIKKELKAIEEKKYADLIQDIAIQLHGKVEKIRDPSAVRYDNECQLDYGRGELAGMLCVIKLSNGVRVGFGYPECREGMRCMWYVTEDATRAPNQALASSARYSQKLLKEIRMAQKLLPPDTLPTLEKTQKLLCTMVGTYCESYTPIITKKKSSKTYEGAKEL